MSVMMLWAGRESAALEVNVSRPGPAAWSVTEKSSDSPLAGANGNAADFVQQTG